MFLCIKTHSFRQPFSVPLKLQSIKTHIMTSIKAITSTTMPCMPYAHITDVNLCEAWLQYVLESSNFINPYYLKIAMAVGVTKQNDLIELFDPEVTKNWHDQASFRGALGSFLELPRGNTGLDILPVANAIARDQNTIPMLKAYWAGPKAFVTWAKSH